MELTILISGTAFGEFNRLRRLAGDYQLTEFLAAERGERCDLIPTAHAVDGEGLAKFCGVLRHDFLPLHVTA